MGSSMAGHLLRRGHKLHVHNRSKAKAQALLDAGAVWHESAGAAAAHAEVVITMLGFPKDVEASYLGEGGVVELAPAGSLLIDMTTSSPALARRIAASAAKRGLAALDAPVSGGDLGAREARLAIMVGGEPAAFNRAKPFFEAMGKNIVLHGPPGSGQICKMANQLQSREISSLGANRSNTPNQQVWILPVSWKQSQQELQEVGQCPISGLAPSRAILNQDFT